MTSSNVKLVAQAKTDSSFKVWFVLGGMLEHYVWVFTGADCRDELEVF
jgi:hypothetical protein